MMPPEKTTKTTIFDKLISRYFWIVKGAGCTASSGFDLDKLCRHGVVLMHSVGFCSSPCRLMSSLSPRCNPQPPPSQLLPLLCCQSAVSESHELLAFLDKQFTYSLSQPVHYFHTRDLEITNAVTLSKFV
jgi:hypothetical protein